MESPDSGTSRFKHASLYTPSFDIGVFAKHIHEQDIISVNLLFNRGVGSEPLREEDVAGQMTRHNVRSSLP